MIVMRKLFVSFLIVLVSVSGVFGQSDPMPALPFSKDCGRSDYDCFANFFLYWLGFEADSHMMTVPVLNIKVEVPGRREYQNNDKRGAQGFLMEIIIPLIALTLITWGLMSQLKIFGRKDWINTVLAFLMVIISARIGLFRSIVGLVFMVGPIYAFGLWGILFFTGLWFIFKRIHVGMKTEAVVSETAHRRIQELTDEWNELIEKEAELVDKLGEETDSGRQAEINKHLDRIKERKKQIEDQRKNIRRQI